MEVICQYILEQLALQTILIILQSDSDIFEKHSEKLWIGYDGF
jgi:hypothetical protein